MKIQIPLGPFDKQTAALRRATPIPSQFKVPPVGDEQGGDEAGVRMNIDFKVFDNQGPAVRQPTPRPDVPDENVTSLEEEEEEGNEVQVDIDVDKFQAPTRAVHMSTPRPASKTISETMEISLEEEEEEADEMANVRIEIPLTPVEDSQESPVKNFHFPIPKEGGVDADVTVDIDFAQFDGQEHTNHMSTPRPDKTQQDLEIYDEEEEEAMDNVRIEVPLSPDDNDVVLDIDYSQFDGQYRTNRMSTPRPDKGQATHEIPHFEEEDENDQPESINFSIANGVVQGDANEKPVCSMHMSTPRPDARRVKQAVADAAAEEDAIENDDVTTPNTKQTKNRKQIPIPTKRVQDAELVDADDDEEQIDTKSFVPTKINVSSPSGVSKPLLPDLHLKGFNSPDSEKVISPTSSPVNKPKLPILHLESFSNITNTNSPTEDKGDPK